jgi:branched-chain amino acid aminotransferase
MHYSRFLDFNGQFHHVEERLIGITNRSFRYGDGLFETMLWENGNLRLLDYHIDRLYKGMNLMKIEGADQYNSAFINERVVKLLEKNQLIENDCRIRFSVFRDGEGLYTPQTNQSAYVIEVTKLDKKRDTYNHSGLIIDIYTEHRKPQNILSNIKSSNALLYVLAGVYRKKHALDDVLLINESGFLVESSSSNLFVWYNGMLYTPALSEGCVDGVMRRSILDFSKENGIEVIEAQINPQILNEAEEIFLTNAIAGMQCVLGYKKKRYFNHLSKDFWKKYEQWRQEIQDTDYADR